MGVCNLWTRKNEVNRYRYISINIKRGLEISLDMCYTWNCVIMSFDSLRGVRYERESRRQLHQSWRCSWILEHQAGNSTEVDKTKDRPSGTSDWTLMEVQTLRTGCMGEQWEKRHEIKMRWKGLFKMAETTLYMWHLLVPITFVHVWWWPLTTRSKPTSQ